MQPNPPASAPEVVAVIDIGSSAARMVIAEIDADGGVRPLENVHKPLSLGRDVFTSRRISRTSQLQAIKVLQGFRDLMGQYQVKHCRAVGTSALREAMDRDMFLDRVFMRTGLDVEVIEAIEENRLVWAAVRDALGKRLRRDVDALMVEVSSGNTDVTLQRGGRVVLSHTIRSGSLRLVQERRDLRADHRQFIRSLRSRVRNVVERFVTEFGLSHVDHFMAMSSEARFVADNIAREKAERYAIVDVGKFQSFVRRLARMTVEEIVDRYDLPYPEAETVTPALFVYSRLIEIVEPKQVVVPMVSLRYGLLLEMAQMRTGRGLSDFARQIVASAETLGRKYHYDEAHARCVTRTALVIFDCLAEDHGLGQRERLLLEVAGVLHDIGTFVGVPGHHKHGYYLVMNSELFGLRRNDVAIVANVVRYHRRAMPDARHPEYMALTRLERMLVCKLAALLRVADALDRGHRQAARHLALERREDEFIITVHDPGDISLERGGLPEKADLFESVFGMKVSLRQAVGGTARVT